MLLQLAMLRQLPLILDKPADQTAAEWIYESVNRHQYYDDVKKHDNQYAPILDDSLVSVVAETGGGTPENIAEDWPDNRWYSYYEEGFITEKTFRQFLHGHPMLWIAPPFTIKLLKYLGFKTFDTVWMEDYDEMIMYNCSHLHVILI